MNTRRLTLGAAFLTACFWLALPNQVKAEEARGVFQSLLADNQSFTMVDAKRDQRTFLLGIHAVVVIDNREAKIGDLRGGDSITVMWETQQGRAVATLIVCKRH